MKLPYVGRVCDMAEMKNRGYGLCMYLLTVLLILYRTLYRKRSGSSGQKDRGRGQVRGKKETRSRKLSHGNQTESLNEGRGRRRMTDGRNVRKEDWKL